MHYDGNGSLAYDENSRTKIRNARGDSSSTSAKAPSKAVTVLPTP